MDRRQVVRLAVMGLSGLALPSMAQLQEKRVHRIGFLHEGSRSATNIGRSVEGFLRGMRDLGYVEGNNMQIEWRFAEGAVERLPALASELVQQKVAVIVAGPINPVRAAQGATSSIPIVMAAVPDPVEWGLVSNLRHPGGNTTGLTVLTTEIRVKWVQFLREAVPKLTRIRVGLCAGRFTRCAGANSSALLRASSAIAGKSCLNLSERCRRRRCSSSTIGSCHISVSSQSGRRADYRWLVAGATATEIDDFTRSRIGYVGAIPSEQKVHSSDSRDDDMHGIILRFVWQSSNFDQWSSEHLVPQTNPKMGTDKAASGGALPASESPNNVEGKK